MGPAQDSPADKAASAVTVTPLAPALPAGSSRRSSTGSSRSLTAPHLGDITQVRGRVEVLDDQRVLQERTQDQLLKGGHTFALDQAELQIIQGAHCPALVEQQVERQQASASAARRAAMAQWNLQVLSWTLGSGRAVQAHPVRLCSTDSLTRCRQQICSVVTLVKASSRQPVLQQPQQAPTSRLRGRQAACCEAAAAVRHPQAACGSDNSVF